MSKRGKARNDLQLSQLQSKILLWLEDQLRGTDLDLLRRKMVTLSRRHSRRSGTQDKADNDSLDTLFGPQPQKRKVDKRGVLWNTKQFYDDPKPTNSQRAALSRALRRLEKRGLVVCSRKEVCTTYVTLTEPGWRVATHWRMWGTSSRDMRAVGSNTPESRWNAELKSSLARSRTVLRYATEENDGELEAKLRIRIEEIEGELARLSNLVRIASIKALLDGIPNSSMVQSLKALRAEHPNFFEHTVFEIDPRDQTKK